MVTNYKQFMILLRILLVNQAKEKCQKEKIHLNKLYEYLEIIFL